MLLIPYIYSGYFSRGYIFVVFVVERRTTKYLHTKKRKPRRVAYVRAPKTTKFFPRNSQNYDFHENITPRKIPAIRYIYPLTHIVCRGQWLHKKRVYVIIITNYFDAAHTCI